MRGWLMKTWGGCAAQTLVKMRGTHKVDAELHDIQGNLADTRSDSLLGSARKLFSRAHWKQAAACMCIPFFQQFTGMNAIMVRPCCCHPLQFEARVN